MSNVLLVQSPDGDLAVANIIPSSEVDCESNVVPTYVDTEYDFIQQMEVKSSIVKVLCITDILLNMVNFVYTGLIFALMCSFISLYGFLGAVQYKPSYLFIYMCYLYFSIMSRVGAFFFMMYLKYNQNMDVNEGVLLIIPISVIIQTYVTQYVYNFYVDCKKICP